MSNRVCYNNLYTVAREETVAWLTMRPSPRALTQTERFYFRFFGIVSLALQWTLTVLVVGFILWRLTVRWEGIGAVLGAGLALFWFRKDARSVLLSNKVGRFVLRTGGAWYVRWPVRFAIVGALAWGAVQPYAMTVGGECRVVPAVQMGVRAELTDQIVSVSVREGDLVEAGDVISELSGREVRSNIRTTEAQIASVRATLKLLKNGALPIEISILEHEVAIYQVELEFQEIEVDRALRLVAENIGSQEELDRSKRLRDGASERVSNVQERLERMKMGARDEEIESKAAEIDRLTALLDYHRGQEALLKLRAPMAGRVVTSHVENRLGQELEEGDLVCIIQSTDLLIEMDADEKAAPDVQIGMPVDVRLWGYSGLPLQGIVLALSHTVGGTNVGGDLAVRTDPERLIHRASSGTRIEKEYHLQVKVRLSTVPEHLTPGMTGFAKIRIGDAAVWESLAQPVLRFIRLEAWSWFP